ncbi:MAG: hypothetical protein AVDCRST_MAG73-4137, partial [uncultured Thermomicrobiales bacterium]
GHRSDPRRFPALLRRSNGVQSRQLGDAVCLAAAGLRPHRFGARPRNRHGGHLCAVPPVRPADRRLGGPGRPAAAHDRHRSPAGGGRGGHPRPRLRRPVDGGGGLRGRVRQRHVGHRLRRGPIRGDPESGLGRRPGQRQRPGSGQLFRGDDRRSTPGRVPRRTVLGRRRLADRRRVVPGLGGVVGPGPAVVQSGAGSGPGARVGEGAATGCRRRSALCLPAPGAALDLADDGALQLRRVDDLQPARPVRQGPARRLRRPDRTALCGRRRRRGGAVARGRLAPPALPVRGRRPGGIAARRRGDDRVGDDRQRLAGAGAVGDDGRVRQRVQHQHRQPAPADRAEPPARPGHEHRWGARLHRDPARRAAWRLDDRDQRQHRARLRGHRRAVVPDRRRLRVLAAWARRAPPPCGGARGGHESSDGV